MRSFGCKAEVCFALQTCVAQCEVTIDPACRTCYTNQTLVTHYMSDFASRAEICTLRGRSSMIVRSTRSVVVCACLVALLCNALPATAQITTGNLLGTVKDSTGGVVPGATVILISESRGTKSVPVVTSGTGDYVFPNITPDTYTVEVTMDGFRTVKRPGLKVSGGDRVTVPALTLEPGGAAETVNVTSEAPLIQASSGERSFAISTVENREPPGQPPWWLHQLHRLHSWRRLGRRVGRRHPPRRRRPEQHHDGRHLGDGHGQQRHDAQHERRVDCRGQGPHPGLPG